MKPIWFAKARRTPRTLGSRVMAVVLVATVIALGVTSAALVLADLRANRLAWVSDLATEAAILELSVAPFLSFDDRAGAARSLAALQAKRSVQVAAIYRPDGTLYARYEREPGRRATPLVLPRATPVQDGYTGRIEVRRPVVQNGEVLGTIYLRAVHDVAGRVVANAQILAAVTLFSLGVALFASQWMLRSVTRPIAAVADIAKQIVWRRDYSLRAPPAEQAEIGAVVDAFNSMLDEVEGRTRDLESANARLQEEVAERRRAQHALATSEKLYRAIGESIEYGVWICDPSGRCTYASESFLALTGLTQEQCSALGWTDRLHPEERDATVTAWLACVESGNSWYREHRIRGVDGQYHHVLAQGVPIRDDDGRIIHWAGINLDIRRLKRTEQALRDADRRKDEFLATLAHELRNPLAPIRNAVRLLEEPRTAHEQRQWARSVIARQVANMALLLDDLLDVSRITRGRLELRRTAVEARAVAEAALEIAGPLIREKDHALEVDLPPAMPALHVDPLRMSQVLANLLTNAAKYTDPGGRIALRGFESGGDLVFEVEDSGIGLDAQDIPRAFEIFSQLAAPASQANGGLGIGLALVKGLVELHGGSVEARSPGRGRGSCFTVRLPLAPAVADAAPPAVAAPAGVAAGSGRHVLVVDDNRDAADSLALLLRQAGYRVSLAYSGDDALEIAARERPHAIVLDIGLPGRSGLDVAAEIRRTPWSAGTTIVALTGWGQEQDRRRALGAGFDGHLTKPVDLPELLAVLGRGPGSGAGVAPEPGSDALEPRPA